MSYIDRLRTLKYISPSGEEFTLSFDELARNGGKKAPVSEFPGQNQGAVQDLGEETISFPVTVYISGADYDQDADRLWNALSETGPAKLIHPRWGNINVLPTTREQREKFIEGARRAVFTITFLRVDRETFEYPKAESATDLAISYDIDDLGEAIDESVPEEIADPRTLAALKENITETVTKIKDGFREISNTIDGFESTLNAAIFEIESNIDALVSAPADLMESMLSLYRLPARTAANVKAKIDGYSTIYSNLIDGFVETTTEYGEAMGLVQSAQLSAIQGAAAESTLEGLILTREEINRILNNLNTLNNNLSNSIETLEAAGDFSADYTVRSRSEQAATDAVTNLVDRALFLPAEKIETLDEAKTILQFVWEKFGGLERLDEIIEYNDLAGNDFLLIEQGTEVAYYE